ncbi:ADP-ribosylglycohydrolase family protein [Nonomuraea insulae]|uniref:ADP-ribosylglycohydrolase family protein n=1 Tax=Nonomuraea insulae TaxID=1616787 RepID=A0ABW1CCI7_9ACTN
MDVLDRVRGCLLGGAIGDALGAPIEFQSLREIRREHGAEGITGYVTTWRGRTGLITDDTQMTLFTVEGLLEARTAHVNPPPSTSPGPTRPPTTPRHPLDETTPAAHRAAGEGRAEEGRAGEAADRGPRAASIGGAPDATESGPGDTARGGPRGPMAGGGPRSAMARGGGPRGAMAGGDREAAVGAVRQAYLRWLDTQRHRTPPPADRPHRTGWLRNESWLYSTRAPGNACLSGLGRPFPGRSAWGEPGPVNPESKGCGTVMRSAPFGLIALVPKEAFELAAACAQITHGHPTGYLAAGAFAAIVANLMTGEALAPAVHAALELLSTYPGHDETSTALRAALSLASTGAHSPEAVESLGGAWVAEEALAIGVYCALVEPSVDRALLLSVNHSGDSDSTGSVCGNLLGALHGATALPTAWLRPLEGRDTIERLATALT